MTLAVTDLKVHHQGDSLGFMINEWPMSITINALICNVLNIPKRKPETFIPKICLWQCLNTIILIEQDLLWRTGADCTKIFVELHE